MADIAAYLTVASFALGALGLLFFYFAPTPEFGREAFAEEADEE